MKSNLYFQKVAKIGYDGWGYLGGDMFVVIISVRRFIANIVTLKKLIRHPFQLVPIYDVRLGIYITFGSF